ncbi:hypothetical protein AB0877_26125 [Micromonospora sp. NPDC047644]|uniref:hypothetical protein n=1 Tax=Micromonospora sp. NPDC047644 TaxID=3157203 RepID=UPI003454FA3D
MAFRTWGRLLLTALGVSVLAGAGQLGVAYGFGIVRLTGAFTGTTVNQWPAQLVWVGWFAANAAVAGAVLTGRLARRDAPPASTGRQLAVGGAAALGATVIAPLCMQPARAAELISVDPVWAVGICAMVGAVIGAGAAIAVLFRPELGWNMAAVAGTVWLLALISVLPSLGTAGPLPTVRLGVLEPSWLDDAAAQRLAMLLLPIVALLAGAATAGLARSRGQAPLVSGATGVAGPVLVAFAYLTAGPGDAVDRYQTAPYYASLIAILAGALGAAAAALLRWPMGARTTDPQAIEPTAILRPLPAGPAPTSAPSDRDSAERTDTELATRTKPAGVVAGPWATGDPDAVRTVPAHWDWPETTASGERGPTPAAPATPGASAQPAAWLTAPTGEFTAAGQTPPRQDDVLATSEPSAAADVSDATATGSTAGRANAATGSRADAATGGRAGDEPTSGTATDPGGRTTTSGGPTGGRTTRKSADTASGTGATGTTGTTGVGSAGSAGSAGSSTEATNTATPGSDAPGPDATASTITGPAPSTAGTADHGTPEAPVTIKPRRSRKSKADPDATATDVADDTSAAGSATTSETTTGGTTASATTASATTASGTTASGTTARETTTPATTTGRATKGTRPSRSADATTSDTSTPSQESLGERSSSTSEVGSAAASGTAATRAAATGAKRAPATSATGSKRAPATTTAGTGATQVPADPESPSTPTDAPQAPTTGTGSTPAPTATADEVGAEATPRAPKAGTDSKAAAADATSASSIAGARGTDSARSAAEDVPAAGLFAATAASDPAADLWTPAPSAWPVTSTWTVPPQAAQPGATAPEGSSGPDAPTGPTPRPRHRAPLPDLSRAGTWNAFDTSRRRGSAGSPDSSTARTAPTEAAGTTAPAGHPGRAEGTPSDASTVTGDLTPTDTASAEPTQPKVAEQPSRRGRLGGLFRRNRSRADEESPKTSDEAEPLASQDEEFVDWVAGLSKPVSDNEPEQENSRRSLRSTGRHHRD